MDNGYEMTSLRTLVRKYIIDGLADGSFCPGDKISELEIVNALGVSRTPTREALLQLNSEGLLDYVPRKGFSIKKMNEKEKQDVYQLIAVLDASCARFTADKLTQTDFRLMHELIDKIDIAIKYENLSEYRSLEMQFHNVYRQRNGNEIILHALEIAESGVVPNTFVGSDKEQIKKLYSMLNDEHRHILELLEKRDGLAAEKYLLDTHWSIRLMEYTEFQPMAEAQSRETAGSPE